MAVNAANARIFGSDIDAIYLAPIGTALPTTLSGTPSGFEDVGWLHSDGITETPTGSKTEIRGHQGNGVVRTRIETPGTTVSFVALEDKPQTRSLRYDIASSSEASGVRTEVRRPGQKVSPRAAVIDLFDSDDETVHERILIPRLEIIADGERVFVNSDIAGFPFIGEIIGSYTALSVVPDED